MRNPVNNQAHFKRLSEEYRESYGFGLPWQIPDYVPVSVGDWTLRRRPGGIAGSYLAEEIVEPPHAVLWRGSDIWMSTGLLEIESHAWHLHCAKGNVLVAGLGMGMYVHAASMKADVRRIVVIERDPDVIELMKRSSGFENWVHRDKVVFLEADALDEEARDRVSDAFDGDRPDYLYADIWPVFPAPEAPEETRTMVAMYDPKEAGWWGQEVEYGLWLAEYGGSADLESLRAFFKDHEIIAPVNEGYVSFCSDTISAQIDCVSYQEQMPSPEFARHP